jgi:hypothetical protein
MLVDFHVPLYDEAGYGEALAETAQNLGVDRLCIVGGEALYGLAANAEVRRVADAYPELFVPFARVSLGEDGASAVERLHRVGFAGLSVWAPTAPYDDEGYFSLYEAAEALGMPILFYTGIMPPTALDRARGVRSANMHPLHLDTVARYFQALTVVGVGMGFPWCEEAAELMRHHRNLLFDLSGDVLRRRGMDFLSAVLGQVQSAPWEDEGTGSVWQHVVFGSAVRHEDIASVERDYQRVLRSLAASQDDVDAVMGVTAARILRLAGAA